MTGERPVSLYLVVPPSDISRTRPLVRLILNQIARRLTETLPESRAASRPRLLLMLDEFPALGRLDFFETSLAFMAGYGVRAFLVAQSLHQIDRAYGANHHAGPAEPERHDLAGNSRGEPGAEPDAPPAHDDDDLAPLLERP